MRQIVATIIWKLFVLGDKLHAWAYVYRSIPERHRIEPYTGPDIDWEGFIAWQRNKRLKNQLEKGEIICGETKECSV